MIGQTISDYRVLSKLGDIAIQAAQRLQAALYSRSMNQGQRTRGENRIRVAPLGYGSIPVNKGDCDLYRSRVHPHFASSVPLARLLDLWSPRKSPVWPKPITR